MANYTTGAVEKPSALSAVLITNNPAEAGEKGINMTDSVESIADLVQDIKREHLLRSEEFDPDIQCEKCGEYLVFEWDNPGFKYQMSEHITDAYCPNCQENL